MSEGVAQNTEVSVSRFDLPQNPSPELTEALYNALSDHRGRPVDLMADGVKRVSVPLVQLLIAAAAEWKSTEFPLRIVAPSEAFLDGLALLGLADDTFQIEDTA